MPSFPDVRWGRADSWWRRPAVAFSATRAGSWTIRTLTPLDRRIMQRSRGRLTALGPIGLPTLLLTTTGRLSGQARTTPLLYLRLAPDRIVVVGSNFGQAHHPAWTGNVLAHPEVTVTIGGRDTPAVATPLTGDEAQDAYAQLAATVPTYAAYRRRTDRAIRVFELRATSVTG